MNREPSQTVLTAVFIQKGRNRIANPPLVENRAVTDRLTKKVESREFKITVKRKHTTKEVSADKPKSHSPSGSKSKSRQKPDLRRNASSRLIRNDPEIRPVRQTKEFLYSPADGLRKSQRGVDSINKLLRQSIRDFSKERLKQEEEEQLLRESRTKLKYSLKRMDAQIRQQNSRRYVHGKANVSSRLPWGANEQRITKYAVQTIQKLKKMSRPNSKSRQAKRRDRKKVGVEFLDALPKQEVKKLVESTCAATQETNERARIQAEQALQARRQLRGERSQVSSRTPSKNKQRTQWTNPPVQPTRFQTEPIESSPNRIKHPSVRSLLEPLKQLKPLRSKRL